jgi:hypothetical protein
VAKTKTVIFKDEEALEDKTLKGIEEIKELTVKEPTEEDIEQLFNYEPIRVEEVVVVDSTIDVIPVRNFSTWYGGRQYFFSKDKRQKVPIGLRDFLLKNKVNPKIRDFW